MAIQGLMGSDVPPWLEEWLLATEKSSIEQENEGMFGLTPPAWLQQLLTTQVETGAMTPQQATSFVQAAQVPVRDYTEYDGPDDSDDPGAGPGPSGGPSGPSGGSAGPSGGTTGTGIGSEAAESAAAALGIGVVSEITGIPGLALSGIFGIANTINASINATENYPYNPVEHFINYMLPFNQQAFLSIQNQQIGHAADIDTAGDDDDTAGGDNPTGIGEPSEAATNPDDDDDSGMGAPGSGTPGDTSGLGGNIGETGEEGVEGQPSTDTPEADPDDPGGSPGADSPGDGDGGANAWHHGGLVADGDTKTYRNGTPIMAQEGEYIIPRDAVDYYGIEFFDMIREESNPNSNFMLSDGELKTMKEQVALRRKAQGNTHNPHVPYTAKGRKYAKTDKAQPFEKAVKGLFTPKKKKEKV